jgi:hypothetical protein
MDTTKISVNMFGDCEEVNHFYDDGIVDVEHLAEAARIAVDILLETYSTDELGDKIVEVINNKRCNFDDQEGEEYCNYHNTAFRVLMGMAEQEKDDKK